MKILRLTLVGCRRFKVRQIQFFDYRPALKTQVVLGSNGAGKSTLLYELSPLPANPKFYQKPGKKEIEIEHHGKQYLLQSLFEPDGNRFIFTVDGENLNPGYTVTVFNELVKQHFNYTPDVHALMVGKMRFSRMSVAERRNWLTKINDTDFTYAIRYFQRLSEQVQDLKGAIKRNQGQLAQELSKCLDEADERKLRLEIDAQNKILNELLEVRQPRLSNPRQLETTLTQLEKQLPSDLERLERLLFAIEELGDLDTMEDLEKARMRLTGDIQSGQREITLRCEQLDQQQKLLDAASATASLSLTEVKQALLDYDEEITQLYGYIKLPFRFEQTTTAYHAFESVKDKLEELSSNLRHYPSGPYPRDTYQIMLQQQPLIEQAVLKKTAAFDHLLEQQRHLEAHRDRGETACPACQHRWTPHYDEATYQKLLQQIEIAQTEAAREKKTLEQSAALIQQFQGYYELINSFNRLASHLPILGSVWDYLIENDLLQPNTDNFRGLLRTLTTDFQYLLKLERLTQQRAEKEKLRTLMESTPIVDLERLKTDVERGTQQLLAIQERVRHDTLALDRLRAHLQQRKQLTELGDEIHLAMQQRQQLYHDLSQDYLYASLDEIIRNLRMSILQAERRLSQIDVQKGIVEKLSGHIRQMEREYELLKLAQKALSPKEGLIAKGMTGFINHFLRQVNAFIERIWLYPLKLDAIAPADNDSIELDYRFPVSVNDDPPPVDLNDLSAGQAEVIDLAFAAVSMKYLGLTDAPIFLDEFAKSLDPAHRQAAYQAIDALIDSSDYSQIFLVSHYQDGYSSLSAAEFLVLCDNNIQLPSNLAYNQHATLR